MRKLFTGFLVVLLVAAVAVPAATAGSKRKPTVDRADIMAQGGESVAATNGAKVIRTGRYLKFRMKMPTPKPGTYVYPTAAAGTPPIAPGWPEVFTGWAFVFMFPDLCTGDCDGDDLGADKPAKGGVYNFDGRLIWRDTLRLSGGVKKGTMSGNPPGLEGVPLQNLRNAEVHLAIAPHGAAIRDLIHVQTSSPAGSPACACWWVALIK